jgi:hypothetical protein
MKKIISMNTISFLYLFIIFTTCTKNNNSEFKTKIIYTEDHSLELLLWYNDIPKRSRHIAKYIREINIYSSISSLDSYIFERSFINPLNEEDPIEINYFNDFVLIVFKDLEKLPVDISFRSNGIKRFHVILDYNDMDNIKIKING